MNWGEGNKGKVRVSFCLGEAGKGKRFMKCHCSAAAKASGKAVGSQLTHPASEPPSDEWGELGSSFSLASAISANAVT